MSRHGPRRRTTRADRHPNISADTAARAVIVVCLHAESVAEAEALCEHLGLDAADAQRARQLLRMAAAS